MAPHLRSVPLPPAGEPAHPLAEALRLERNVAIMAGAGAGKTWSLMAVCLHLLGGAREGQEPLPPAKLGLLTFTDKAAAELRARLRQRLDELASGAPEPGLTASFARLGRPLPPAAFWRRVRDELGGATIGTFHSLCGQLLRRAPAASAVNPAFEVLEEREAARLLHDVVERELIRRIDEGDAKLGELARDFGLGGGAAVGLVGQLIAVAKRIREEGLSPRVARITDGPAARAEFEAALAQAQAAARTTPPVPKQAAHLAEFRRLLDGTSFERFRADLPALRQASRDFGRHASLKPLRALVAPVGREEAGDVLDGLHGAAAVAGFEAPVRELLEAVVRAYDGELQRRGVLDFTGMLLAARGLLREFPEARAEAQARFGALLVDEFQDTNRVQLELVMMLSEERQGAPRPLSSSLEPDSEELSTLPLEPAFLGVVGDRKQAIYEFRGADVSVFELMARRIEASGGERVFLQESRRSSRRLVRVLNAVSARVMDPLRFRDAPRDFEVGYVPDEDDLRAVREDELPGAPLWRLTLGAAPLGKAEEGSPAEGARSGQPERSRRPLEELAASGGHPLGGSGPEAGRTAEGARSGRPERSRRPLDELGASGGHPLVGSGPGDRSTAEGAHSGQPERSRGPLDSGVEASRAPRVPVEDLRAADAEAVARAVAMMLASDEPAVVPRDGGPPRRVRGGDVALLFRRFTHLETWRQALVQHGVRHRVVRGRGFFGAQEVVDVASLLTLLADPRDGVALAAVLRSPWVGLSDASLVRLALRREHAGLAPRALLLAPELEVEGLSAFEQRRLHRFREVVAQLRGERDRLGLRALLRVAFEELQYRVAVAGAPFGEQALANLDKLLELASARDRQGVTAAAFARELLELAEQEPAEAQGEVLDELGGDAVTLCTVHQAKGLEWPVVVLPDLAAGRRGGGPAVRFDRAVGLALRPPDDAAGQRTARRHAQAADLHRRRETAEGRRLLYVALTRARDRLVLGPCTGPQGSWAKELEEALTEELSAEVREVDVGALPDLALPAAAPADPATAVAQVRAAVEAVRRAPAAAPSSAVLPVTLLQEFASCPRRFHFAHQVGLAERPLVFEWREEGEDAPAFDARARGTVAHRLLELTPLAAVGQGALEAVLAQVARREGLPADEEVVRWVARFWRSRAGAALAGRGEGAVRREWPFLLRLGPPGGFQLFLKGTIDVLVDSGGAVEVLDYKTARQPAAGLLPYAFQLGCYALAARRLLPQATGVRAGIVFLREAEVEPRFLEELPDEATLSQALVAHARALVDSQLTGQWEGRPRDACQALGCGYVYRCHPDPAQL